MRPYDSAWAEGLGTLGLIALAVLIAFLRGLVHVLREQRRRRRRAEAAALRLLRSCGPTLRDDRDERRVS